MDSIVLREIAAAIAVVAFNVPIGVAALGFSRVTGFNNALREKDENGGSTGAISYSRVTGMIGAVVVASLFWVISNIVIATAIISPADVSNILSNIKAIFLVGAALFLPYAFNQLKTLVQ
jgi:hypothetical protein